MPDRPPSIFVNFLFSKSLLSTVVFVAINPLKIELLTSSTIESIVWLDSSGDIFKKRDFLISKLYAFFSMESNKFVK